MNFSMITFHILLPGIKQETEERSEIYYGQSHMWNIENEA